MFVTTVFLVMSIQTVRLQAGYRHLQASSAQAETNVGRVNGLIYAIVMESRGIYMSADRGKAKPFAEGLLKRSRELAGVVAKWQAMVRADDAEQFEAFKQRIAQFIEYRAELARLAIEVSPAAARETGDGDGRTIRIQQRPMEGGGWVVMQEDVTGERQKQRILERTEQLLATIVENIPEGIVVKGARNLRYVFVNKAAEEMIGMSRAEITGKTARELFSVETAELIEQRDRQLMERKQQTNVIVDTVDNPVKGRQTIAVRRLQIGGPDHESHLFVSMVEDRTGRTGTA